MQKTTLRIPTDVWRDAKVRAIQEDRDLQDLVADALRAYLARPNRKGGSR